MRILVVTGASGGHIFPALGLLDTLKNRDRNITALLVLPKRNMIKQMLPDTYETKYLSISGIKLNFEFQNLIALWRFLKGSLESLAIFMGFKPDIVVGFGTIDCVPMLFFAWMARIRTLIHEQNVIPGRANRLLAKFVDKVAISFQETRSYLHVNNEKIILTGNPLRLGLRKTDKPRALQHLGLDENKFTILVMGGSSGSHTINMVFLNALSAIQNKKRFQAIHIAGSADYDLLHKSYQDLGVTIKLYAFLQEMHYAYSASDIIICRAGATTIAELVYFGLPAIVIPYPYAYKHQIQNARVLTERGCAVVIEEEGLRADKLTKVLEELMNEPDRMKAMRSSFNRSPSIDANELLADTILTE